MTTILHILQFTVEPQMLSKFNAHGANKNQQNIFLA